MLKSTVQEITSIGGRGLCQKNKKDILAAAIEFTFHCNLKCIHCYRIQDYRKKECSYEELCHIFDELAGVGCLWIEITGGEPLLRKDFLELYGYLKKKGFLIILYTNGSLLTHKIVDYFCKYPPYVIQISVYGKTKETYNGVTRTENFFDKCWQGINLIIQHKLPLRIKTVALNANKEEIPLIKEYARTLGADFRCDPIIRCAIDGSTTPYKARLSPEEVTYFDLTIEKRFLMWRERFQRYLRKEKAVCLHGAGRADIRINPYGYIDIHSMYPCISAKNNFDILKNDFKEGLFYLDRIRQEVRDKGCVCTKCKYFFLCDSCSIDNTGFKERVNKAGYYCQLAQKRSRVFETIFEK
jgi:MoaA/NifB/PqqE/SkfB family radical SAM enzyme